MMKNDVKKESRDYLFRRRNCHFEVVAASLKFLKLEVSSSKVSISPSRQAIVVSLQYLNPNRSPKYKIVRALHHK